MILGPTLSPRWRAALFGAVGVLFFLRWLQVGSVDYQDPETLNDWAAVIGFSVALLTLAFALPVLAGLMGSRLVFRVAMVPATGALLGAVANILEDGLGWEPAFWLFIGGLWLSLVGLIALTVVMVWKGVGSWRALALVAVATLAGQLAFEPAGGPILLVTWLAAAVVAIRAPDGMMAAEPASV